MTLIFDLVGAQSRDHGERGIARYVLHLALGLNERAPDLVTEYWVRDDLPVPGNFEPLIRSGRVRRVTGSQRRIRPAPSGVFLAGSVFENYGQSLDYVLPHWAFGPGWRTMAVLYDLIPLNFPDWYLNDPITRFQYLARADALSAVDRLLAISDASAADATRVLGVPAERLTTIWAGADSRFRRPERPRSAIVEELTRSLPDLRSGYIMFPSGIEPRKNVDGMLEAYAQLPARLRQRHQLVLVCRVTDIERETLRLTAEKLKIADQLVVTGFVPDETLVHLYQAAELVVFPATYEGFGLPVLEGMRCGAPVVCSDSSSLVEIQTDAAARFDPSDPAAIAATMLTYLEDDQRRAALAAAEPPPFSWEFAAERTAAVAAELLDQRHTGCSTPNPVRLALISPLSPQASGIATYATRMVEHLRHLAAVTVFVEGPDAAAAEAPPGVDVAPVGQFERHESIFGPFDHVVYFIGNSSFHVDAVDLLTRRGGTVLLHDARLTGLFAEVRHAAPERLPGGSVGELVRTWYPHRYRPAVETADVIDAGTADRFGIQLARPVVAHADRLLTHSRFAADLIELDTGCRPDVLFGLPHPEPAGVAPADRDPGTIVSFGLIDPIKAPEVLIDAFALITRTRPEARLVFVGSISDDYRQQLDARLTDPAIASRVEFTGHADVATYDHYLNTATVAVQLRRATNGESSGVIAETMATGLPTIVTALGPMGNLDPSAVVMVPTSVSPTELAEAISEILDHRDVAEGLSRRALALAAANTYADAARTLFDTVTAKPPRPAS